MCSIAGVTKPVGQLDRSGIGQSSRSHSPSAEQSNAEPDGFLFKNLFLFGTAVGSSWSSSSGEETVGEGNVVGSSGTTVVSMSSPLSGCSCEGSGSTVVSTGAVVVDVATVDLIFFLTDVTFLVLERLVCPSLNVTSKINKTTTDQRMTALNLAIVTMMMKKAWLLVTV